MTCPCGEVSIRTALSPEGKIRVCAGCGQQVGEPVMVPPQAEMAREEEPAPLVAKPAPRARQVAAPIGAAGTIRAAKLEARALRADIRTHERALKKARAELEKLERLLDAAEARPRAVVRPIRTTA